MYANTDRPRNASAASSQPECEYDRWRIANRFRNFVWGTMDFIIAMLEDTLILIGLHRTIHIWYCVRSERRAHAVNGVARLSDLASTNNSSRLLVHAFNAIARGAVWTALSTVAIMQWTTPNTLRYVDTPSHAARPHSRQQDRAHGWSMWFASSQPSHGITRHIRPNVPPHNKKRAALRFHHRLHSGRA